MVNGHQEIIATGVVIRQDMAKDVVLAGIVPTIYDSRLSEAKLRLVELGETYGADVTDQVIPDRPRSTEASGAGVPVRALGGPAGAALSAAYAGLAIELDKRVQR